MALEKLELNHVDENGEHKLMDGLSFVRALNKNAETLGTETKLDLDTHNTPQLIKKALREQTGASKESEGISYATAGYPDDIPTFEEKGAPINSPSELCEGIGGIYNRKATELSGEDDNEEVVEDDNEEVVNLISDNNDEEIEEPVDTVEGEEIEGEEVVQDESTENEEIEGGNENE